MGKDPLIIHYYVLMAFIFFLYLFFWHRVLLIFWDRWTANLTILTLICYATLIRLSFDPTADIFSGVLLALLLMSCQKYLERGCASVLNCFLIGIILTVIALSKNQLFLLPLLFTVLIVLFSVFQSQNRRWESVRVAGDILACYIVFTDILHRLYRNVPNPDPTLISLLHISMLLNQRWHKGSIRFVFISSPSVSLKDYLSWVSKPVKPKAVFFIEALQLEEGKNTHPKIPIPYRWYLPKDSPFLVFLGNTKSRGLIDIAGSLFHTYSKVDRICSKNCLLLPTFATPNYERSDTEEILTCYIASYPNPPHKIPSTEDGIRFFSGIIHGLTQVFGMIAGYI